VEARNVPLRLAALFRQEFGSIQPRLLLARLVTAPFPAESGNRLRALVLRAAGFDIGKGTLLYGMPILCGPPGAAKRLTIGRTCLINQGCYFDLQAPITIGNRVGVGPQVMLMTATHEIGTAHARAGVMRAEPVVVEDGVWLGARATVLPGVTIGAGSVIAAGVVVSRSLPPHTLQTPDRRLSLKRWRP
jgi:maltose O-acetyltransferase